MSGLTHIHQCPRCELRFTSSSELEYHLSNDHRPRRSVDVEPAAVKGPAAAPPPTPGSEGNEIAASARSRQGATVTLALAGAVIVLLAALATSTSTTLIIIGLVLVLVGCYSWRAYGRRHYRDADPRNVP